MKLEAGKEMDRQCVVNWLNEVYVTPSRAFSEYTDDELKMFAHDALVLLKEQEAVKPYIDIDEAKCPICKVKLTRQELLGDDVLFEDFFDYCPHCGKPVKWV